MHISFLYNFYIPDFLNYLVSSFILYWLNYFSSDNFNNILLVYFDLSNNLLIITGYSTFYNYYKIDKIYLFYKNTFILFCKFKC